MKLIWGPVRRWMATVPVRERRTMAAVFEPGPQGGRGGLMGYLQRTRCGPWGMSRGLEVQTGSEPGTGWPTLRAAREGGQARLGHREPSGRLA